MVAGIALMDSKKKVTISWSGGKDCAFALYKILQSGNFEVAHVHTVVNTETKRVGMHGISEALLRRQVDALGLKLVVLYLEGSESHAAYETLMKNFYRQCVSEGIAAVVFGDIFLEDLKNFRDKMLKGEGLEGIYPLWKIDSKKLIHDFVKVGFKTLLCAANAKYFSEHHLGKTIDKQFIDTMPAEVDVCGENGEFHTFVYDGPIFKQSVVFQPGPVVEKVYEYKMTDDQGTAQIQSSRFLFKELLVKY